MPQNGPIDDRNPLRNNIQILKIQTTLLMFGKYKTIKDNLKFQDYRNAP